MKIALSFPGCHRRGGVERVMWECARFLASRGHEVHVFAHEWEEDAVTQAVNPIIYHRVPVRARAGFLRGAAFFSSCSAMLRPDEYDVVNPHGCVCPVGGVEWVHSLHRAWLHRARDIYGANSSRIWKQKLNPVHPVLLRLENRHFRGRGYAKLIALTPRVREDLHTFYDVPASDVEVLANGFSPDEFDPLRRAARRDEMRAALKLESDDIALLFVANELERKGYPTLLEAVAKLKRPDVRVLVVGKPDEKTVMAMAEKAGVTSQVTACGPTRDVASFHAAADLFVLPTQYEAFCLAILEALGSGVPVVTSRVPGAEDAILPGQNGALISDPRDANELAAVLEPLLDTSTRERLSHGTPATVEQYRWPNVLSRYEDVLSRHASV